MAKALDRDIRKVLDKAVRRARIVAEDGARKALAEIGLEDAKKPAGLSSAQTELRNRLRAHARSLDDIMESDGSIKASRLVREIAYEHWHRALFARFLTTNNLLLDPEHKVAISLAELELIAKEEGRDLIELAGDWAEPMLPQIFNRDDPVLALALPPETKAGITDIVKGLPRAVFEADDSLGWVYQFWQADQKDRINEETKTSGKKIGADELPAVTQLFTEDYMVLFLLENTLGAWWAGKELAANPELAAGAVSEDELREKTSPPGYRWTYLRFVREACDGETHETATGSWRPAAGTFEGWPKAAKDVTVLDPCMGSGHFLVFALPILVAFRRSEERLDERAAVRAVLAENLYGLEIDPRCTQIAAFALALASWKRTGGPEQLPRLNLACSGLAIGLGKAEFLKLAGEIAAKRGWTQNTDLLGDGATPMESAAIKREREGLARLYDLFEKAPCLGSLIDPHDTGEDLFAANYSSLAGLLGEVLETGNTSPEVRELTVAAQGIATAADLLGRRYALVTTNVPYLGRGKMNSVLRAHADFAFSQSKPELASMFIERGFRFLTPGGTLSAVFPQNILFLSNFASFRKNVLLKSRIDCIVALGEEAWETFAKRGPLATLAIFTSTQEMANATHATLDATDLEEINDKRERIRTGTPVFIAQVSQVANPDHRIIFSEVREGELLRKWANSYQGIATADGDRFLRLFFEFDVVPECFEWQQSTVSETAPYSGRTNIMRWDGGKGDLASSPDARIQGLGALGRRGVAVSQMRSLAVSIYSGHFFDNNGAAIVPHNEEHVIALWAFCSDPEFARLIRVFDKSVKVTNATLTKVPFDLAYWMKVASERYPRGLPRPHANDPTQWLFDGHPRGSADPNCVHTETVNPRLSTPQGVRAGNSKHPLQVAVARLLGYRWPRRTGSSFMDCPAVSGPDELDQSGLVDTYGIVPLHALNGKPAAATRLRELIRAVWGPDYGEGTIRDLLTAENSNANDLATWLADEFFDGHCALFHQTPFIWHIWDGAPGGFSALVNYHRLCEQNGIGRRLLEKLRDTYIGEWIAAQRSAHVTGEEGAEDRLIAAEHLRGELTKIIEGEPPYDIFVRWKPLYRQAIGWEPDMDDGVRVNIRPFLNALPKNPRSGDACILRVTPRVKKHAGADRGAEPRKEKMECPWFWAEDGDVSKVDFAGGPEFKGRRYNDFHFSRTFKQRARDAQGKKS